jgi:hypothetical protein
MDRGVKVGNRYGMLIVIGFKSYITTNINSTRRTRTKIKWECRCDCGKISCVDEKHLSRNYNRSCGCLRTKLKHGKSKTREWRSWAYMRDRCLSETHKQYPDWGGRGIKVCDEWKDLKTGFINFLADMGPCPDNYSLDRIDVNGDYCPENCRWADRGTQNFNTRMKSTNTSGRTGVTKVRGGKYVANISVKGVTIRLGTFSEFNDACVARTEAELKYYGVSKENDWIDKKGEM